MAPRASAVRIDSALTQPTIENEEDVQKQLKDIRHKIDLRIISFYAVSFVFLKVSERNIVNSAILNLEQGTGIKRQLGISEAQWAWVISAFTYGFLLFEFWSTFLFKHFGPRKFMVRLLITWGIVSMSHSAAQNFAGLTACRVLLGMCEAGFLPGALYHLTFWYPADKLILRYSILFACVACSGVLSGCLAWAIAHMNGVAGLPGWRWLFILEGFPAILCAIAAFFWMPTYPSKVNFLSDDEKELLQKNLSENQPRENAKTFDKTEIKALVRDPTFYLWLVIFTCQAVGGYSVSTILSTIIYQLGLQGTTTTQLLTMPSFVLTAILQLLLSWLVQKKKINTWLACICFNSFSIGCYVVLQTVKSPIVKYVVIELGLSSAVSVFPLLWPERVRCAHGTSAAGLAISVSSTCVHLTGLVGPHIYSHRFAPHYEKSFLVSVVLLSTSLVAIVMTGHIIRSRDRKEAELAQNIGTS